MRRGRARSRWQVVRVGRLIAELPQARVTLLIVTRRTERRKRRSIRTTCDVQTNHRTPRHPRLFKPLSGLLSTTGETDDPLHEDAVV